MKRIFTFALLCTAAPHALAQAPAAATQDFSQTPAYKECSALATTNPAAAQAKAEEWLKIDDGVGVHHCRAMALYGQRRFPEAAEGLSNVRTKIPASDITLRTYVARQGATAWLDAGRPDAAVALLGQQINDMSQQKGDNATEARLTSDLLLDRARVHITYGKLAEAVQDLDHAVSLTPLSEDVLVERAGAFKQLGDASLARQDLQSVQKLNPKNAKAAELLKGL